MATFSVPIVEKPRVIGVIVERYFFISVIRLTLDK
jgi:hypothetical protein